MAGFKGRGALGNPQARFLHTGIESVDDGWYRDELPESIATQVRPEPARSIISRNKSPDIPFDQSINPYRGCEHGCIYCLRGDTPVLMADGTTRPIAALKAGDAIFGSERQGWYRRYVRTRVLAHWSVIKPAYRITLEDGTVLEAGADHRFLTERGWKFVTGTASGRDCRPHLTTGNRLMGTGAFARQPEKDAEYRRGYLCGMERVHDWLQEEPMEAIRTHARVNVQRVRELVARPVAATRSWRAGFLAGIFDAEGSYSDGILRISNTEQQITDCIQESLSAFGFKFAVEHIAHKDRKPIDVVRLLGGLQEHLRFFHSFDPAISRKRDIAGQAVKSEARLGIISIEALAGAQRLYDITTGTEDFIANGVVSHNCYARPSHAYMDLSPGIDFETKIFYKADAARLLEEELGAPGYVPKQITIGANTDPYQPLEKDLKVTRSLLEVFERTRHPVSFITKGSLILRDLDLLRSLAADQLVQVFVSITTLDSELKRKMEPRTASPQARLRVVRELSAAGIPTGVMVAPMIPMINDSELEHIIEAIAAAGAMQAAYVLLRLPHELKELFKQWLEEHFPDRAEHVMSLIRSTRDGRENDPNFGSRMVGSGAWAQLLRDRFALACKRHGLNRGRMRNLSTEHFRAPARGGQMSLL